MTTTVGRSRTANAASPERTLAGRVVGIMFTWQFAVSAIGAAGAILPSYSSIWLRVFLVTSAVLCTLLAGLLLSHGQSRPVSPLGAAYGLTAILGSLTFHIAFSEPFDLLVLADNTLRLLLPLLIVLGATSAPRLWDEMLGMLERHAFVVDFAALWTIGMIVVGRSRGWSTSWLTGDPLVALLAFPLILRSGRLDVPRLALYLFVIALSGKRWTLLCWLGVVLVSFVFLHRYRLRRIVQASVGGALVLFVLSYTGALTAVTHRTETAFALLESQEVLTASSISAVDASSGQRVEEVRLELSAWIGSAENVLLGRDLVEIDLRSGGSTHAIHATPVFLLVRGGFCWLVALLLMRGGHRPKRRTFTLAAWLTLLESAASNNALDPTFGLALAIATARKRDT